MITRIGSTITLTLPSEEIAIGIEWFLTKILSSAAESTVPSPTEKLRIRHPGEKQMAELEQRLRTRQTLHEFDNQNPVPRGEAVKTR